MGNYSKTHHVPQNTGILSGNLSIRLTQTEKRLQIQVLLPDGSATHISVCTTQKLRQKMVDINVFRYGFGLVTYVPAVLKNQGFH